MNHPPDTRPATSGPTASRPAPALGLVFLSPLVGEYLHGSMHVSQLQHILMLAAFYGGGALLIRETARRLRLGWPAILLLALAFAVVVEALIDQTLFNPGFLKLNLIAYGYIPALGTSPWWAVYVLTIHTVWTISVPIALVEALTPNARHTPWLTRRWLPVVAVLVLAGSALTFRGTHQDGFMASPAQLTVSSLGVLALIVIALRIPARPNVRTSSTAAPPPPILVVAAAALVIGSLHMALLLAGVLLGGAIPGLAISGLISRAMPAAVNIAGFLAVIGGAAFLVFRWSQRPGWSEAHRLALATGFLLTYAWFGLVLVLLDDDRSATDLIGQLTLIAAAVFLIYFAGRQIAQSGTPGPRPATSPPPSNPEIG